MQEFLSISVLIVLAAISPGPDFAIVTKNSLLYSRKAGIYTSLGVSVSLLVHAIYCILGLALIISKSLMAFSIIKYLGALYLIYLGIKGLLTKRDNMKLDKAQARSQLTASKVFYQGFLGNLLNPKAIIFLLAFFTLVMKPGQSLLIEMAYGIEIAVIHMIWFSSLSLMMTHALVKKNLSRIQFYIVKAMGTVLIAFGIRIATLSQAVMLPAVGLE
jgi:RhtB (resistance to homoserine/threonine) family protein